MSKRSVASTSSETGHADQDGSSQKLKKMKLWSLAEDDVPVHRRGIYIRPQPTPEYVRVAVRSKIEEDRLGNESIESIRQTFNGLVRPVEEKDDDRDSIYSDLDAEDEEEPRRPPLDELFEQDLLTPEERRQAIQIIQAYGEEGVDVAGTTLQLVWKLAAKPGQGQGVGRPYDMLFLRIGKVDRALCTYPGCFARTGTRCDVRSPRCFFHKGENFGFAVFQYAQTKKDEVVGLGSALFSFKYENEETKLLNLSQKVASRKRLERPPGDLVIQEVFATSNEAEERMAILQTVELFRMLNNTDIKLNTGSISLAIGLESGVLEELKKVGLQLKVIAICNSKKQNQKTKFPFGTRAKEDDELKDLTDKKNKIGGLYICCDENIIYGGQTKATSSGMQGRHTGAADHTMAHYQKKYGKITTIALAAVPFDNLGKMESHLHVGLFIAYLLNLRNPFCPKLQKTKPYSLNKMTVSSHFDKDSWGLIRQFLSREFGVNVDLVAISEED